MKNQLPTFDGAADTIQELVKVLMSCESEHFKSSAVDMGLKQIAGYKLENPDYEVQPIVRMAIEKRVKTCDK